MLKKCLVFPEKKTFFQKFLWWRRRRFRKEGQRNSAKSKKLLAQNHELTKKIPNLYFSTKRSSGRVNTVQSTSESSKYKYCSLEMYFSSKIYSAEPVPILETLLRKWKNAREFLSNSLSTRRVQFWKELRVVLVSCQKSLNMSRKIWNWRIYFFQHKVFLDI